LRGFAMTAFETDRRDGLQDEVRREGFAVVRNAVPEALCEAVTRAFEAEVKPAARFFFMRHRSGPERHRLTAGGFMKYPIMNVQDLPRRFGRFRTASLSALTHEAVRRCVGDVLGGEGRLVHTMFFDGNQETWAHRDAHYMDSERRGTMLGVWIALEDIDPGAGRFYVLRRSHETTAPGELEGEAADPNGAGYRRLMREFAEHGPLERVAPILERGDMILWSSLTVHGSLPTERPDRSRRSLTGHYLLEGDGLAAHVGGMEFRRFLTFNGTKVALRRQHGFWKRAVARHPALARIARRLLRAAARR